MICINMVFKWKCDDIILESIIFFLTFRLTDCSGNVITATDAVNSWGAITGTIYIIDIQ